MRAIAVTLRKAAAAWRRRMRQSQDRHSTASTQLLERGLKSVKASWSEHMGEFRNATGVVELPLDPPLTDAHLLNCRVLSDRRALLKRMTSGGVAAEIGVETGRFSRAILEICRPTRLHLIDLDLKRFDIAGEFRTEIDAGVVRLHEGDSSPITARFPDRYFDFIYIDGDHTYYGVKRDIEAAHTKVKPDGFLLFNDYTYWSPCEGMRYGVVRAVNELCLQDDWQMVYFAFGPNMYCDVALQRRASA